MAYKNPINITEKAYEKSNRKMRSEHKKDTGKILQELDLYEEEVRPKVMTKDGEKRPRCVRVKLGDFEEGAVQIETTYDEQPF